MAVVGGFLAFIGLVAIAVGLVRLLLPSLKAQRSRSRNILIGGIAGLIVGAAISPAPTPQELAAFEKQQADTKAKSAAAEKALAADEAKTRRQKLQVEASALWREIIAQGQACDNAGDLVADAAKSGDRYRLYEAAKKGEQDCDAADRATRKLEAPQSLEGEAKEHFQSAVSKCGDAHLMKQLAFGKIAEVADGDMRPSAVAEAKSQLEASSNGGLYCAAAMMNAASKAGLDLRIFQKKS